MYIAHYHVEACADDDLRRIARFSRQFDQNTGKFTIVEVEVIRPFNAYFIRPQIVQHFRHDDADDQTQTNGSGRALLESPVHGQIEVSAKWRKPFATATAATGLLIFSNAGIAGFQLRQTIQKILVRRINHRQHRNIAVSDLAADRFFIQQLNRLRQAVALSGNREHINTPVAKRLDMFIDSSTAHAKLFTQLLARMKLAVSKDANQG